HAHPPAPHQPHTRFPTRRSSDLKAEQTDLHWFYRRHLTDHEHGHEHAGQNRKVAHCGPPFAPGRYPPEPAPTTASLRHPRTRKRSEEHTSELQSRENLVCRLLLE